jgi:hypothetical protein
LAQTTTEQSVFFPGYNSLTTNAIVGDSQVPTVNNLLRAILSGDYPMLHIYGYGDVSEIVNIQRSDELNQGCMLQRIISNLDIKYSTSLLRNATDVTINTAQVTEILEKEIKVQAEFTLETLTFNFNLYNISMSLYNEVFNLRLIPE